MKASELIQQLVALMEEHGDLEVMHGSDSMDGSDEVVYCPPPAWTNPNQEGTFDIRAW